MSGDLVGAAEGRAPSFLVAVRKDPLSGNLDRIQIVKLSLDAKGKPVEHVHDVVWSGDRTLGEDGNLPAVGSTVDVEMPAVGSRVDVEMTIQERAYTSPIWYTPPKKK